MARPMIPIHPLKSTPSQNARTLTCWLGTSKATTSGYFALQRPSALASFQIRQTHTRRHVSSSALDFSSQHDTEVRHSASPQASALSCLPLTTLIRSYLITSVSSVPALLRPSLVVLSFLAKTKISLLNPDHNPVLRALLKRTFYAQFCAGENATEANQTIDSLKTMGYKGVILGHAREVVLSKEEEAELDSSPDCKAQEECNATEIEQWKCATLETIKLAQEGDFVALKFTGAGRQALKHLKATIPCAPELREAINEMCRLAQTRGVGLLFDAEQAALQQGIDNWTMHFMKRFNTDKAIVYGTYQAYAKRTPQLLATHLAEAQRENFVLGVKLVRGAYLGSDPRELFWDSIEDTHICYDELASCLLERRYGGMLQPTAGDPHSFPRVGLVLASHNAESVQKARTIRDRQAQAGIERIPMAYGQLMGMADHVSCQIVQEARSRADQPANQVEIPQSYKYLVWGTMGECMKYLLRRAQENKDAVSRTVDARKALGKELARRLGIAHA